MVTPHATFRLKPEIIELLDKLASDIGIGNRSGAMAFAVRETCKARGLLTEPTITTIDPSAKKGRHLIMDSQK